jgi:hypothetical protein
MRGFSFLSSFLEAGSDGVDSRQSVTHFQDRPNPLFRLYLDTACRISAISSGRSVPFCQNPAEKEALYTIDYRDYSWSFSRVGIAERLGFQIRGHLQRRLPFKPLSGGRQ